MKKVIPGDVPHGTKLYPIQYCLLGSNKSVDGLRAWMGIYITKIGKEVLQGCLTFTKVPL